MKAVREKGISSPSRAGRPAQRHRAPHRRGGGRRWFAGRGLGEGGWGGWEHYNLPPNSHRDKFDVV